MPGETAIRGGPFIRRWVRAAFPWEVGEHGIPCSQVLPLRIRVGARRESVQRPYPHHRYLLLLVLEVSSNATVCILALSAGSRGACAALWRPSACCQFIPTISVMSGPLWRQFDAGPVTCTHCCSAPTAHQLQCHFSSRHSPTKRRCVAVVSMQKHRLVY